MPEWKDTQYNGAQLDLGIVTVAVFWDSMVSKGTPTGYKFRYANMQSNRYWDSMDEAKVAAVYAVRKRLQEAISKLD